MTANLALATTKHGESSKMKFEEQAPPQ